MKLTNLKITPKLGILVGVTLLGLCIAGALAGYLMQREMLNARVDQAKAIVDMALNLAAGLKKQVDAGQMTREAALAEFGKRAKPAFRWRARWRRHRSRGWFWQLHRRGPGEPAC